MTRRSVDAVGLALALLAAGPAGAGAQGPSPVASQVGRAANSPGGPQEARGRQGDQAGGTAAQPKSGADRPQGSPRTPPAFTLRGTVDAGFLSFAARESLEAVYGSKSGFAWGGGVRLAHRSGLFAQVTASRFRADGERVFVFNGQVFPLGIPSTLTITPIDFTAGWRFLPRSRPPSPGRPAGATRAAPAKPRRWAPYVGGGFGLARVEEEADFAQGNDDVSSQHTSYHVLGGLDLPVTRWLGAGVEAGYRWVPNALEGNGVAKEFGERDLNHLSVIVRLTIGQ